MMEPTLSTLSSHGICAPLDIHFARAMGQLAQETREIVLVTAALVSRHVRLGHVCLDLQQMRSPSFLDTRREETTPLVLDWPAADLVREAIQNSPLVGESTSTESGITPLVLDTAGRVYLRRYWSHQQRIATALLQRVYTRDVDSELLTQQLDDLFSSKGESAPPDWQRIAACVAVCKAVSIISGGPGTGKTSTVVKILAILVQQAVHAGQPIPRIVLLAPTGKAAMRLAESIQAAREKVPVAADIRAAIPSEVATVHRCLGARVDSSTTFRHHRDNPVSADVVVVDEASMIDLALMSYLVDALPPTTQLILLGDENQLASVEAGAVLGDMCNTDAGISYSPSWREDLSAHTGRALPANETPHTAPIADCIVRLTQSYRYAETSGIGRLATAINAGKVSAVEGVLAAENETDVALVPIRQATAFGQVWDAYIAQQYAPVLQENDPQQRLQYFEKFRVLCAHREGPFGVTKCNRYIETLFRKSGLIDGDDTWYPGRPIVITQNDAEVDLFNGDVGICIEHAGKQYVYFRTANGAERRLLPMRLPPHETAFAMSVHRSQGSEFDAVAVLLPDYMSPVLSRELLYTAVTRARKQVRIYATQLVLTEMVKRRVERNSGLRDAVWQSAAAE